MVAHPAAIGRYQIRGGLGTGGFATVYRARDPALERDVALKVLHPQFARDAAVRERFVREGRALARVRHPNLVVVYEAGEADGVTYLATELIEGRPLDDELARRGRLPLAEVTAIAEQVAGALAALHARDLIHRDIKPANIMIEAGSGRAVLLDLGVARDLAQLTLTGDRLLGTPAYMAPEQVRAGGQTTPRTDVYQLGATVYALLAGRPPFEGTPAEIVHAVASEAPADLAELLPELPPAVAAAVMEALANDPERRPSGPREFADRLRAPARPRTRTVRLPAVGGEHLHPGPATDDDSAPVPDPGPVDRAEEHPGGRGRLLKPLVGRLPAPRRRLVVGAVLGVVLIGVAGVLLTRLRHDGTDGESLSGPLPQVSELTIFDSLSPGRSQDTFAIVGGRLVACFSVRSERGARPLTLLVTGSPDPPAGPDDSGAIARSEELAPGAGNTCAWLTVGRALLPFKAYWVHVLADARAVAAGGFTVLPDPADVILRESPANLTSRKLREFDPAIEPAPSGYWRGYEYGEYVIRDPMGGGPTIPVGWYLNSVIAVEARLQGETERRSLVLGCRNIYFLHVDPAEGTFSLRRRGPGEGPEGAALADWQPSGAINRGTATNRIVLRCVGDTLSAAINGTEIMAVREARVRHGMAGFGIATRDGPGPVEARFKDLVLARHPAPEAPALTKEPIRFTPKPEDLLVNLAFDDVGGASSFVMPHQRPNYQYATEAGEFVVRTSAVGESGSGLIGVPPQVGDAITGVDVRLDGQITDASVRLACRVSFSGPNFSGYFVWLDPIEGTFGLHRKDLPPEGRQVELVEWQQSDAINRGAAVNLLMLRCVGDTISVIINGHEVGSARDGAYRSGLSGVEALRGAAVRGELEAHFDNFIIARP